MEDLAFKEPNYEEMYPSATGEKSKKPPKRYPQLNLPISMLKGKEIDLNTEITIKVKGKISRLEKSKYSEEFSVELKSGDIVTKDKTLAG